jgi:cobalt-zinc-cadmium efflux system membrane fusion protein
LRTKPIEHVKRILQEEIMNYRDLKVILLYVIMLFLSPMVIMSCGQEKLSAQKEAPAKIDNPVEESELTTITLTPRAEERLGIETAPALYRSMPGFMELGGEIIAPPGTEIKVSAPLAGTVRLNSKVQSIFAGAKVKKGQEIMKLLLMPPEQDLMGAQEEAAAKQVEYDVARAKMVRMKQMFKDGATSEKALQEAQAELASAQASLNEAKGKLNLLNGTGNDSDDNGLSTLVLETPIDGILYHLYVAPGQTVPVSTALFDVVSQKPVWVRVPVYSGNLSKIDLKRNAVVRALGVKDQTMLAKAVPVQGPPLSNALSASSYLYYQLPNEDGLFRIGERVRVKLVLKSEERDLVIPLSSIAYDIYGGTWVYVKTAPQVFLRRRVEVARVMDDIAVITSGIQENDQVVTTAVAELYGAEFGGLK